jgi:hypothetical protein
LLYYAPQRYAAILRRQVLSARTFIATVNNGFTAVGTVTVQLINVTEYVNQQIDLGMLQSTDLVGHTEL